MKIEVLCSINSGQYNIGDIIDVSPEEAMRLLKNGFAKETKSHIISEAKPVHREIPEKPKKPFMPSEVEKPLSGKGGKK